MECALKITGIEIELLTYVNRILDYENGIRGGITRTACHYVEPNNKYMCDYGETKKDNSDNRWALSQLLPYGRFDYVEDVSMFI